MGAKHRKHSLGDELVARALAALDVANDATAVDDVTSAVSGIRRPAAMVGTSVDSGMETRIRVAIAWASEALLTTKASPTAFAWNADLEYLRRKVWW